MNCAGYLADFLIKKGVTDVFGFSGGYIVPFIDALSKRKEINVHVCYNEQGCAFAACGYARTSGKLGVYFTTSGPGAVNALGGLADAWFDSIPVMGIRQNGFQEMDIVSMVRSITKYSVTPSIPEKFPEIINRAYNLAMLGRKGGVVIDFPFDVQKASIDCR